MLFALVVRLETLLGITDHKESATDVARCHTTTICRLFDLHEQLLAFATQSVHLGHCFVGLGDFTFLSVLLSACQEWSQLLVDLSHASGDLLHCHLVRVLQSHCTLRLDLSDLLSVSLDALLVHVVQDALQELLKLALVPEPLPVRFRQALEQSLSRVVVQL